MPTQHIAMEKSFPSHKAHRAALISIFNPQPDTSFHCETTS